MSGTERSIYYSCLSANASSSSATAPVLANFIETRQSPIVERCSDWRLSVVRLTTPAKALPTYRLMPLLGQADPNLMDYEVSLTLTMQGSSPPFWPQTIAAGACLIDVALFVAGSVIATATLQVAPGTTGTQTFVDAADLADVLQAQLQATSARFATCTVSADFIGRLKFSAGNPDYEIAILDVTGVDGATARAFAGFAASQFGVPASAVTGLNAAGLQQSFIRTLTSSQTARIRWIPEDQTAPKAAPPLLQPDYSSTYYWGHSVTHAVGLWNTAYASAYQAAVLDLQTQWRSQFTQTWPGVQTPCPFMTFDPASQLFSMNASPYAVASLAGPATSAGLLYPAPAESLVVTMDESSDALFGNFNEVTVAGSLGTAQYATLNFALANVVNGTVQLTQDATSLLGSWTPVTSILVTSNQVPVKGEQISAPFVASNGNVGDPVGIQSAFSNVIAEVSLLGQSAFVPSTECTIYEPTAIRSVQLAGSAGLTTLQFGVAWRDNLGVVRDLYLPASGGLFTLKCQFTYVGPS